MTVLPPEQADALRELHRVCHDLTVDVVVIGAIALRVWIPDEHRLTEDIDVAVALDLDGFAPLAARLVALGWRPDVRWEPRWHSPRGARVDLLPFGMRARQDKQIVWPRAETVMRVVGFDRAFEDAVFHDFAPDLRVRVPPAHVLARLSHF